VFRCRIGKGRDVRFFVYSFLASFGIHLVDNKYDIVYLL